MPLFNIPMKEVGLTIQLVGAIYADSEQQYHMYLPGEDQGRFNRAVGELTLEEWSRFLQQTDFVEVECLVKDPETKQIGRAILRKSERQVSQGISWQVFRRDGFKCRYCGAEDVPLTVDHLITWESGGPSIPANLVAACRKCNGARGETPYADWLQDPYYKKVSQNLGYEERFANQALVPTLAKIPINPRMGKRNR